MTVIKIEGAEYPFPDDLTMDEAIILERQSGINLADLAPGESLPIGAVKAFAVIALMRAHPDETEKTISARIGKIKISALEEMIEEEDTDAGPPVSPPNERDSSTETSGDGSRPGSDPSQVRVLQQASGHPLSDRSASDRGTSAA